MNALPKILAGLGLLVCAILLLRQLMPTARRAQLDALGRSLLRLLRYLPQAWHRQRQQDRASREARAAIERARRLRAHRDGTSGPADVHDLDAHRRRRRKAADPASESPSKSDDGPSDPPPPTLH